MRRGLSSRYGSTVAERCSVAARDVAGIVWRYFPVNYPAGERSLRDDTEAVFARDGRQVARWPTLKDGYSASNRGQGWKIIRMWVLRRACDARRDG